MIEASLLAWCPESIVEKTQILCIKRCARTEALCVVPELYALLEHGPVCTSEPGFSWTEEPGMCIGLTV